MGLVLLARAVSGQTLVSLPDASLTTTLTASVSEQARASVPNAITFMVDDTTVGTDAAAAALKIANIVQPSATSTLRILARASAPAFAPPTPGATTWSASDVAWKASAWTNATSSAGQLAHDAFTNVATCTAGAASCGTNSLLFTLAPKRDVGSGQHQLVIIWKLESLEQ